MLVQELAWGGKSGQMKELNHNHTVGSHSYWKVVQGCAALKTPPHLFYRLILLLLKPFSSSRDTNFSKLCSGDPSFKPENQFWRPYFWKPGWHIPTTIFVDYLPLRGNLLLLLWEQVSYHKFVIWWYLDDWQQSYIFKKLGNQLTNRKQNTKAGFRLALPFHRLYTACRSQRPRRLYTACSSQRPRRSGLFTVRHHSKVE